MHFAAVSSDAISTAIRYAIARSPVNISTTSILFFKSGKSESELESAARSMTATNSLLALMENPCANGWVRLPRIS